jgi:hypothetical protein
MMTFRDLVPYLALAGQLVIFFRVEHIQIQEWNFFQRLNFS